MSDRRRGALAAAALVALALGGCEPTGAARIRPAPGKALDDRGRAFQDGCHLKNAKRVTPPRCVYGVPDAPTTAVLLGDSHGLQWFGAMHRLARREGWRLVSLTRAGCTSADVTYAARCDRWRRLALRRIERERPALVVVSNATSSKYRVTRGGRKLSRRASQPILVRGFARTLRRLRATGAAVAVIQDQGFAPKDVVACVARHRQRPDRCTFRMRRPARLAFDAKATRRTTGARLIDPLEVLCGRGARRCRAVIDGRLVYRNDYHLTATFSASTASWLAGRLPGP